MSQATVTSPIPELDDPMILVERWLDEATRLARQPHPNAMTLATVGADARPSARVVLFKGLNRARGYARFYTNYASRKAAELDASGWAAGVMHWDALGRQLRFEGPVVRAPGAESDTYFASRPWRSKINAWASRQSAPLGDPGDLEREALRLARRFAAPDPFGMSEPPEPVAIPRPVFWGGYRFWFGAVEAWSSGRDRFHHRVRYERDLSAADAFSFDGSTWTHRRLQP